MAFTQAQKMYAYYVIATVETHCNYALTNQSDAITLGIMQWYGVRAYRLMARMKTEASDAYEKLSSRLKTLVDGGEGQNWNGIYLQNDDRTSWAAAAALDSCKKVQDDIAVEDIQGYIDQFNGYGGSDSNVKTYIMWMSAWHQGPRYAQQCMQSVGVNASLDSAHNAILSNAVLGRYSNRYNTVYDLLNNWDGTSEPPDFGQVGGSGSASTDPGSSIEKDTLQSQVGYVEVWGDSIVIHGKVTESEKLICYNTGKGIWLPKGGTVTDNPGGGNAGAGGSVAPTDQNDPADFPAARQLWYDNNSKWNYSQGPGRLNPESSGYSDCSACIYWAVNKATNNKYSWIGTWTGAMQSACHLIRQGTSANLHIDRNEIRPGDIILIDYGGDGVSDHVDWYMGNGVVWGAGSAPLPKKISDNVDDYLSSYYGGSVAIYWIMRFFD